MTTTNSIDNVGGTDSAVNIKKIDESTLHQVITEAMSNGATRTTYKIATGDPLFPLTVGVQHKLDPKGLGGHGQRSTSFTINTWARSVTDTDDPIVGAVNAMLVVNLPADVPMDVDDVRILLENLYSLTYASVTSSEPESNRLAATSLFGLTDVIG